MKKMLKDNGGRRSGKERRLFFYAAYLPERRTGSERRSGDDRRAKNDNAYTRGTMPDRRRTIQPIEVAVGA